MNKVVANADEAIRDMRDGAVIMSGGFGLCGNPENLIDAIHRKGVKNLTVISNNCGTTDKGLGVLLQSRQVRKMVASYVGENKEFERQYLAGELEVELNPQGTLAERIRIAGAGLGGFFTPTGAGTQIAEGKESRVIDGREMIFEKPLKADYAIIRAWKGDKWGNLVFRKTARNFSPMMCTAARITIAEVENLVEVGEIDGDLVHVPSVYVKRIFKGSNYQRPIEKRTTRKS
jgi:3-oxoacid CoA-transferase subunit A